MGKDNLLLIGPFPVVLPVDQGLLVVVVELTDCGTEFVLPVWSCSLWDLSSFPSHLDLVDSEHNVHADLFLLQVTDPFWLDL